MSSLTTRLRAGCLQNHFISGLPELIRGVGIQSCGIWRVETRNPRCGIIQDEDEDESCELQRRMARTALTPCATHLSP